MKRLNGTPHMCEVCLHDPKAPAGYRVLYRGTRRQCEFFLDTQISDDECCDCYITEA